MANVMGKQKNQLKKPGSNRAAYCNHTHLQRCIPFWFFIFYIRMQKKCTKWKGISAKRAVENVAFHLLLHHHYILLWLDGFFSFLFVFSKLLVFCIWCDRISFIAFICNRYSILTVLCNLLMSNICVHW